MHRYRSRRGLLTLGLLLALTPAIAPAQATDTPVRLVTALYQRYAWEVVLRDGEGPLFSAPQTELARWFTPELVALLLADRACAARTQQICGLDFAPMWDSQDPDARGLVVEAQPNVAGAVRVRFMRGTPETRVELRYTVVRTSAGWRIADIGKAGTWSLKAVLTPARK